MKNKKLLPIGLVVASATIGLFLWNRNDKRDYDYSPFYVAKDVQIEDTELTDEEPTVQTELSLELLQERNSDVVGILRFKDDVIYQPIAQTVDNKYYERKNIDKEYAAAGIPFLSFDSSLNSKNMVIYGHSSNRRNIIFTPLMNYLDINYYKDNKYFTFETNTTSKKYAIFAVFGYDTKDLNDSLEFMQTEWRKDSDFENFINGVKAKSFYDTGITVTNKDNIMTLVTCDTRDNSKRIIVIGKEIQKI